MTACDYLCVLGNKGILPPRVLIAARVLDIVLSMDIMTDKTHS